MRSWGLSFATEFCPALVRTRSPFTSALLCKLAMKSPLTNLRLGRMTSALKFEAENLLGCAVSETIQALRKS